MGFRYGRTYHLTFVDDDDELDGLEVTVRPVSLGKLIEILDFPAAHTLASSQDRLVKLLDYFVDALDEWNLEDADGQPVPHDAAVIAATQPRELLDQIVGAWLGAMVGVSRPLEQRSNDGDTSLEASMPMEVSSPSP